MSASFTDARTSRANVPPSIVHQFSNAKYPAHCVAMRNVRTLIADIHFLTCTVFLTTKMGDKRYTELGIDTLIAH